MDGSRIRRLAPTLITALIATLIFAFLVYKRRWISDDGLIAVRSVRQILEGNGPVYNAFERAEANTSTLWTYLLALIGAVTPASLVFLAIVVGGLLAIGAFILGIAGATALHTRRGSSAPCIPAGGLVVLAVSPFWDFSTSGLESGLCLFWLALCFYLLVRLDTAATRRRRYLTAIVFGLGPLVRPDFAVASIAFLVGLVVLVRPPRRQLFALAAAALALPVLYELFRMGYYGIVVPLPALAKSASSAEWSRGLDYLQDFTTPYRLWIPLATLAALFVAALATRRLARTDQVFLAVPWIAAALLGLYVLRVGGDFMHGRMLLPVTFLAVLPCFALPLRLLTAPFLAVLIGWAAYNIYTPDVEKPHEAFATVGNERLGYTWFTRNRFPTTAAIYIRATGKHGEHVLSLLARRERRLVSEGDIDLPLHPRFTATLAMGAGRLGTVGVLLPLDAIAADTLGLANPLGGHLTATNAGNPGHEKPLPLPWLIADFADLERVRAEQGYLPLAVQAAYNAMRCGELAELLASVREPLTASRFLANLTGAVRRTRLVVPADPFTAEQKFCGTNSRMAVVTASSSYEDPGAGWSAGNIVDGVPVSLSITRGYSSDITPRGDHAEWIELTFPAPRAITSVVLHPRNDASIAVGSGYPLDFTIETWNGTGWTTQVTRESEPQPTSAQTYALPVPVTTNKLRVHASKLRLVGKDGYLLQLAELETR